MKLFLALALLVGGYVFVLLHTTNIVLSQAQHLNATYQYVGTHATAIASGQN